MSSASAALVHKALSNAIRPSVFWTAEAINFRYQYAQQFIERAARLDHKTDHRNLTRFEEIPLVSNHVSVSNIRLTKDYLSTKEETSLLRKAIDYISTHPDYNITTHTLGIIRNDPTDIGLVLYEQTLAQHWLEKVEPILHLFTDTQLHNALGPIANIPRNKHDISASTNAKYLTHQVLAAEFYHGYAEHYTNIQDEIVRLWNKIHYIAPIEFSELGVTALQTARPIYFHTDTVNPIYVPRLSIHPSRYHAKYAAATTYSRNIREYYPTALTNTLMQSRTLKTQNWTVGTQSIDKDHPSYDTYKSIFHLQCVLDSIKSHWANKCAPSPSDSTTSVWNRCTSVQPHFSSLKDFARTGGLIVPDFVTATITRNSIV